MRLPLFLARRFYAPSDPASEGEVSGPAVIIAAAGVAIGLAVMIITVAVVMGFKQTIRDKLTGFGSHIQVQNLLSLHQPQALPLCVGDSLLGVLRDIPGVAHVERFANSQGILKTDDDFLGVVLKGLAEDFDTTYLCQCIVEGQLPQFSDTASTYPIVISQTIARKLSLPVGSRVYAYFFDGDQVRTRRFTVTAVYQTHMKRFDDSMCLTDLYVTRRLNGWTGNQCDGVAVKITDFRRLDAVWQNMLDSIAHTTDGAGNMLSAQRITDIFPQVFNWLQLLDVNVWIILALMLAVAGFTMISGLLIIILERTQTIGTLKALGAPDRTIRRTFLWLAVFIVGRGMIVGNVLGIGALLLQRYCGIVSLDPQTYYVAEAPVVISLPVILLINLATFLISVLVLVGPSYFVATIHPAESMRYE